MSAHRTYTRPGGSRSPGVMYPPIALSRTPAADDTDGATKQTVEKMCELIRESAADPLVQQCAAYAKKHFACGNSDPAWLAWGVFWYVKHCVKFRNDEATMFRVGEANQQDLLIAPAVLVRMKDPSEDCDGFTMLSAAMLTILGVPIVIATVAVDLDDPSRWSHVFLCAIINGRVKPLDTSHGIGPGWMVPRSRINRWQTWTLDGRPANVQIPTYQGLNGYVSRSGIGGIGYGRRAVPAQVVRLARAQGFGGGRGIGQDDSDETGDWFTTDITEPISADLSTIGTDLSNVFSGITGPSVVATTTGVNTAPYFQSLGFDSSSAAVAAPLVQAPAGYTGPTIVSGSSSTPAAPTGYQWATLINASGNNLAKILTISQGGSAVTLANGSQLLYGAGATPGGANLLSSLSTSTGLSSSVLLLGGIGLLAFLVLKK